MAKLDLDPPPRRRSSDHVPVPTIPNMTEKSVITGEEIKKQLNVLIVMTLLLYVGVGLILWWVWDQSQTNTHALCAIRRDFQNQSVEGKNFLKIHPHGAFGLTSSQLQQSINNSEELVSALSSVNC